MASFGAMIPYLILASLAAALLWGSILALRGRRWWATVVMTVGSGLQVLGALLTCGGSLWMAARMSSVMASSSAGSPSALSSAISSVLFLLVGGLLVMGLGFLLFAAGFLALCGRYGASERRAAELEVLVEGLQQRIEQ